MTTLELQQVAKAYPGTVALKDLSVRWTGGNIHALIGRNGAGKSTLVKILTGAIAPTSGAVLLNGNEIRFRSPADAQRAGIAAVYQELSLLPDLSIAENIHLGRLPRRPGTWPRFVDWKEASRRTGELFERLHLPLSPSTKVGTLPVAQQQMVEIAKAMSAEPDVLLLDEPTSALSFAEAEAVFALLRTLAAHGVLILYITHRLGELRHLAGTITALRDGVCGGSFPAADVTPAQMVNMMFGEDVKLTRMLDHEPGTRTILQVRGLSRPPAFEDVHFNVREGEVLGIAGLLGSGRTELLRTIAGADVPASGEVLVNGRVCHPADPGAMKRAGVVMAPENRKEHGLVTSLSVRANLCLANLSRLAEHGFVAARREDGLVATAIRECGIGVTDQRMPVNSLSGGNQQKVVLGKWLATDPNVLLLDEPTRGIDLSARAQIAQTITALSKRGLATVVVSSELEELLLLCHRILVMRHGRIAGELDGGTTTLEVLLAQCMEPT
jgi:ABC-type sugar transport system ATPase subunit